MQALELQKVEARWKDRLSRELAAAQERHEAALRGALFEAQHAHLQQLESAESDRVAAEERLQQVLRETSEQQQELTTALAKMRAQYESDKQREGLNSPEFQALEARRRTMLEEMEASHREKEEAFRAAKGGLAAAEQRLKDLEEAWLRRRAVSSDQRSMGETMVSAATTVESTAESLPAAAAVAPPPPPTET